jgi:hypothetical protein
MFIVCPSTIWNASALETQNAPKRMLGRITLLPRRGIGLRTLARLVFEIQILRYLVPLIPFVVAMLIWPHLALPISQAPVPMLIVIAVVETKVLSISPSARDTLISDADMERGLDAFRFNATKILTRIAVNHDLTEGEIMLVVEQSEIARVPPLTLVSVQKAAPKAAVLDLSPEERHMIQDTLFDDPHTARQMHLIALRQNENLRSVTLDVHSVSAHARMAALMQTA